MTRTSRNVTVGLIVTLALAGIGWTWGHPAGPGPCPGPGRKRRSHSRTTHSVGGAGLESDLHRHAHCDEYGELRESTARGDRSYGDLRCVQRHRTALHPNFRSHGRAPDGASRRAAVIAAAYTALVGLFPSQQPALDASYAASLAALSDDCEDGGQSRRRAPGARAVSSAASPGEPRWRRPCSPGARPMGSARATRRSPAGPRSASGGRHRRRSDR